MRSLVLVLMPFVFQAIEPDHRGGQGRGRRLGARRGYGVAAVKDGLERFLGGPRSAVSLPFEKQDHQANQAR